LVIDCCISSVTYGIAMFMFLSENDPPQHEEFRNSPQGCQIQNQLTSQHE
jgi:hypothetical protein